MVHALPSLQDSVLFANTHPVALLQESEVQAFPSLHCFWLPEIQLPPWQVSPTVQAFPSLHGTELGVFEQPLGVTAIGGTGFPSSQFNVEPDTHTPPLHWSSTVQTDPSEHAFELGVKTHPTPGSHESVVQGLLSLHVFGVPALQTPLPQRSPTVQAFPSSQGAVLGVLLQPLSVLQESVVHPFPSSQDRMEAPVHAPWVQVSPRVQAFPSSQGALFGVNTHIPYPIRIHQWCRDSPSLQFSPPALRKRPGCRNRRSNMDFRHHMAHPRG